MRFGHSHPPAEYDGAEGRGVYVRAGLRVWCLGMGSGTFDKRGCMRLLQAITFHRMVYADVTAERVRPNGNRLLVASEHRYS